MRIATMRKLEHLFDETEAANMTTRQKVRYCKKNYKSLKERQRKELAGAVK